MKSSIKMFLIVVLSVIIGNDVNGVIINDFQSPELTNEQLVKVLNKQICCAEKEDAIKEFLQNKEAFRWSLIRDLFYWVLINPNTDYSSINDIINYLEQGIPQIRELQKHASENFIQVHMNYDYARINVIRRNYSKARYYYDLTLEYEDKYIEEKRNFYHKYDSVIKNDFPMRSILSGKISLVIEKEIIEIIRTKKRNTSYKIIDDFIDDDLARRNNYKDVADFFLFDNPTSKRYLSFLVITGNTERFKMVLQEAKDVDIKDFFGTKLYTELFFGWLLKHEYWLTNDMRKLLIEYKEKIISQLNDRRE